MARALAFVQLLIICLSLFPLHLLVKLVERGHHTAIIADWAHFLARYALWFIPVPILWAIVGTILQSRCGEKVTNTVGIILTVFVFVFFAVPLIAYLR